ncbi:LacI family DNA-binding transcriptional regulator [Microbacterium gorillae]|uniref:LacI family DNA-binding transcriptional regulator n=1 Tax=Microbacterium gorillae TaxID=1231063 RepID=UPI00058D54DB|nr:LacI family DNA-binding transcriptional regulator [Microbacterium gorillae]
MAERRPKAPTIVDVAAAAGVSKSAVSRALLGQGEVSVATRERVETAAKELGYVANAMARGLVTARTSTIGVILRDVTRPYYAWLINGMQQEAERQGFRMVTMTSAGELEVEDAVHALETLVSMRVDGIVLASARLPSSELRPYVGRVPIVVAGRREVEPGVTSVYGDDAAGGRVLADRLADLGHRTIAVLLVDQTYSLSQHTRGVAMIAQARERGLDVRVWPVDDDRHVRDVLAHQDDAAEVTAIMCPTDDAAVDALDHLREAGRTAPADCSITGFDGIGVYSSPFLGLTTFRQPVSEIGHTAMALLTARITGDAAGDQALELHGSLVTGRTAGPPPQR